MASTVHWTGIVHVVKVLFRRFETMKRGILWAALLLALSVSSALAQSSVDGTWSGTIQGPQGDFPVTMTFETDGAELTGTISDFQGGQTEIENGSVQGDTISFQQTFAPGGQPFSISYVGRLVDGELAMVVEVPEMSERIEFTLVPED
jgi:hypothetical protein